MTSLTLSIVFVVCWLGVSRCGVISCEAAGVFDEEEEEVWERDCIDEKLVFIITSHALK